MFKIYDLNFKEVPLPLDQLGYGIKGLDINIGPIQHENVYTSTSRTEQLYKKVPKTREVTINILYTSKETVDWRMKRDNVYRFFRQLGAFYVAEEYQPHKLLKVIVEGNYNIERPIRNWGKSEISLKVLDTPFRKSLHSTGEIIKDEKIFNNYWSFGMGLSFESVSNMYSSTDTFLRFLNAGDQKIKLIQQPESVVRLEVMSSTNYVEISDAKNIFRLTKELKSGDILEIKGSKVLLNGQNCIEHTNFVFLEIREKWNYWQVLNLDSYKLSIDFKYLYD